MKIIKGLKQIYYLTALQKSLQVVNSTDDENEVIKHVENSISNIDSLKKIFIEDKTIKKTMTANATMAEQLFHTFHFFPFVQHFVNNDFDQAFFYAQGLYNTSLTSFEKYLTLDWSLQALGQLKNSYTNNANWLEYNRRFYNIEEQLIAQATTQVSHSTVENNNMLVSCAYLKFIGHELSDAQHFIDKEIALIGKDLFIASYVEEPKKVWFSSSVDINSYQQFSRFICQHIDYQTTNIAEEKIDNNNPPKLKM